MPDSSRALGNSTALTRKLLLLAGLTILAALPLSAQEGAGNLKLLISVEQTTITVPFPARVTLNLHNAGKDPLWLYTPVRDSSVVSGAVNPFTSEDLGEGSTTGGSSLDIHLVRVNATDPREAGSGRVLEIAGFPHPKLVVVAPGEDYEEKAVVELGGSLWVPGDGATLHSAYGAYKFSVTYRARYSNGPNLNSILGNRIWEGEVESNTVELQLRPMIGGASVTGSVVNAQMQPLFGILVTLSDQQQQSIAQAKTDENGKFSFSQLPFGFYWLTVRRVGSSRDETVLRHVTPGPSDPSEDLQIGLLPVEVYHPDKLLHKPVLFRVLDSQDKPAAGITLDDTWSTGTVSDETRGSTNADGTAMLQLIPGRNFVTLARRGCPKQDERVDVAPGTGIEGFKLVFECSKK